MHDSHTNTHDLPLNPAEELAFIRKVMQDSRRTAVDNGMNYMFWGVWTALSAIVSYCSSQFHWHLGWYLWGTVIPIGWVVSWLLIRQSRQRTGATSLAGNILVAVWAGCGIASTLVGFVGGMTVLGNGITGVIAMISGTGFYISGVLYGSAWLRYYAAIGWWSTGVLMFLFPGIHVMVMLASAMMLFQLIPGIVLYRQWRHEQAA
jgi:hypothetical protein